MQTVWVITLVDYGLAEVGTSVYAVCASRLAVDLHIARYVRSQREAGWRTNRRGFKGNWADKSGRSFEVAQMQVVT